MTEPTARGTFFGQAPMEIPGHSLGVAPAGCLLAPGPLAAAWPAWHERVQK